MRSVLILTATLVLGTWLGAQAHAETLVTNTCPGGNGCTLQTQSPQTTCICRVASEKHRTVEIKSSCAKGHVKQLFVSLDPANAKVTCGPIMYSTEYAEVSCRNTGGENATLLQTVECEG